VDVVEKVLLIFGLLKYSEEQKVKAARMIPGTPVRRPARRARSGAPGHGTERDGLSARAGGEARAVPQHHRDQALRQAAFRGRGQEQGRSLLSVQTGRPRPTNPRAGLREPSPPQPP
jgi:hypothetical protein